MTISSVPPLGRELDAALAEAMGAKWYRSASSGRRGLFFDPPSWFTMLADGSEAPCVNYDGQVPDYSSDLVTLQPVLDEIEKRDLGTGYVAALLVLVGGPKWPGIPGPHHAWALLRASPEQCSRAALSVLRPREDTPTSENANDSLASHQREDDR